MKLTFFLCFLGLHLWHREVPSVGVESELQLPVYATATSMPDSSQVYTTARGNSRSLTHWERPGIKHGSESGSLPLSHEVNAPKLTLLIRAYHHLQNVLECGFLWFECLFVRLSRIFETKFYPWMMVILVRVWPQRERWAFSISGGGWDKHQALWAVMQEKQVLVFLHGFQLISSVTDWTWVLVVATKKWSPGSSGLCSWTHAPLRPYWGLC